MAKSGCWLNGRELLVQDLNNLSSNDKRLMEAETNYVIARELYSPRRDYAANISRPETRNESSDRKLDPEL